MKIIAAFRNRCWPISSKLPLAHRALASKIAVAVSLVAGLSLASFGQSFQNLNFDEGSLVPVCGTYPDAVEIGPAFPGWSVFTQVPYVLYDDMFLDSAGVSIFGSGFYLLQGKFSVLLEAGFTLPFSTNRLSVAIAQAGTIPPSSTRILFDASTGCESNLVVSISGQQRPFYALATFANYTLYAMDVSEFAGQTVVLEFTCKPNPPPGPAVNAVLLDDIRFYTQLTDPMVVSQPVGRLVAAGETVLLSANAIGSPPLGYQWFLNGTAVVGARSSYLQLTNIQLSQAGTYRLVVSNGMGAVTSAPALVSVHPRPTYTVLHHFTGSNGSWPVGNLVSTGATLYGTAYGGSGGVGTVFKVGIDGSNYTVLHNFAGPDGDNPIGLVLSGATLYGGTADGGAGGDFGVLYKINTDGSSFTIFKDFSSGGGSLPQGSLQLLGSTLYGTTWYGGAANQGVLFKLNTDGSGYTVLHNFTGSPSDGASPFGGMALSGTTLYGTTFAGGGYGSGTLFKVQIDGSGYTLLKQFNGAEGANPTGDLLLLGTTLYGTTQGLSPAPCGTNFYGTVFKINTDGTGFTVLHNFTGAPRDGAQPYGGLASCGSTLYGTTSAGGIPAYVWEGWPSGYGTVFMLNTDGSGYRVLKEFTGGDGAQPLAGLLLAGTTLYGTADIGGISDRGVVFALFVPIPTILTAPASQTAEVGGSVIFTVQTSYDPSLGYQWFFNGTNILNGAAAGSSLHLADVQFSDAGVYTVVVTNAFGAATSAPATLSVVAPVERRMVPALTLMGQPGTSLSLDFSPALAPAPLWTTFDHVPLTAASQWYFDLNSSLPPQGFFRAWQSSAGAPPALDLHFVPALTVTGAIGSSVRVDYINQFGSIDAWVTNLATVTLTNTTQLYFDTSAIGQPQRLYRLVPVP